MDQCSTIPRKLICALAIAGLSGCTFTNVLEPGRIDYKSATPPSKAAGLEVPPDLTQLQQDNRYQVPDGSSATGTVKASTYTAAKADAQTVPATTNAVAPNTNDGIHIERDGNQRWLVVKQTPEALWPQVKDFWQDSGFLINVEKPAEGIMETDWAENRAKIPSDFIHETLGKVLDSMWDTGERDKFRIRFERRPDGYTEIYISHRGAEQVVVGQQKDSLVWQPRPSDPGLEADFLARLMARLSNDPGIIKNPGAKTVVEASHSKLVRGTDGGHVEVDEGFDRAWRRVGLALDRVGFTVEDRDRVQGIYFVRYVDEKKDAENDKGFLSRIFGKEDPIKAQKYQISVKDAGDVTRIVVLNGDGKPEVSGASDKILGLLNDQLK